MSIFIWSSQKMRWYCFAQNSFMLVYMRKSLELIIDSISWNVHYECTGYNWFTPSLNKECDLCQNTDGVNICKRSLGTRHNQCCPGQTARQSQTMNVYPLRYQYVPAIQYGTFRNTEIRGSIQLAKGNTTTLSCTEPEHTIVPVNLFLYVVCWNYVDLCLYD